MKYNSKNAINLTGEESHQREKNISPCPFCGGHAELQEIGAQKGLYCVKCLKCWAKSIFVEFHKQNEAIENWNKRVF